MDRKVKLVLLSAGLGNIFRGFEISTANWYNEIKDRPEVDSRLAVGGKYKGAISLWNLPRNGKVASMLKKIGIIKDGCRLEQFTFSIGALFFILSFRPDVIWLKEATLGNMLLNYRKWFGLKYTIVFCDGAPVGHQFAKRFDYIGFLNEYALTDAINDNIPSEKCSIIPNITYEPSVEYNQSRARQMLGIPSDKFVVICVAAWNRHHKRINYLLEEIAEINSSEITLLLCGQTEEETESLKLLAKDLKIDVRWQTLTSEELSIAYFASDLFVLPSLNEALGSVITEASLHALPVLAHPHYGAKSILGNGYSGLIDLSINGNLTKHIKQGMLNFELKQKGFQTRQIVREKFDRKKMVDNFISVILSAHLNK